MVCDLDCYESPRSLMLAHFTACFVFCFSLCLASEGFNGVNDTGKYDYSPVLDRVKY